jgi:hypothetical protein
MKVSRFLAQLSLAHSDLKSEASPVCTRPLPAKNSIDLSILPPSTNSLEAFETTHQHIIAQCIRCDGLPPEEVAVSEDITEDILREDGGGGNGLVEAELFQGEGVDTGALAVELGVDFKALEVADDEERRVAEIFVVADELLVGFLEVAAGELVLEGEGVALPDIGVAFAAADLGDVLFKGVVVAHDIFFGGMGDAQRLAEVAEVLLVRRPLGELGLLPFDGERCEVKRHGSHHSDRAGGLAERVGWRQVRHGMPLERIA